MRKSDVETRVSEIAEPIAESLGLELVDIEYRQENRQMVLRIFIDKDGGVTLDDCAGLSRELSEILEVEDFIRGRYNLEVSSPGLNRPLKKAADFERFLGKLAKISTYEPMADDDGNMRKTFLGELTGFAGNVARVRLKEGQTASIPLDKVAKANLEFEF